MVEDDLDVRLLGPVEALRGGRVLSVGGAKQRTMLAVLALSAQRVVAVDTIASAVWGDDPPVKAAATLQVYASNLRRALGEVDGVPAIAWKSPGYRLVCQQTCIDLFRFRHVVRSARDTRATGFGADAGEQAATALAMWSGEPLGGLSPTGVVAGFVSRLTTERRDAVELWVECELATGGAVRIVPELERLVAEHPFDEALVAHLMTALYRSGRQADALELFRVTRTRLADELGIDPGPALREVEAAVLSQATTLHRARADPAGSDVTVAVTWADPAGRGWLISSRGVRYPLACYGSVAAAGRSEACEVMLGHPSVSRRHAEIRWSTDHHELVDLGSTNGTRVNGIPVVGGQVRQLDDGDQVAFGSVRLAYLGPTDAET